MRNKDLLNRVLSEIRAEYEGVMTEMDDMSKTSQERIEALGRIHAYDECMKIVERMINLL